MERKTFRFENDEYNLARMQPWWCYKDGGADGGGVGPGTGRNEGNPAGKGNRGNRSGGTSSGVSGSAAGGVLGGSQAATRSNAAQSGNTNSGGSTLGGNQAATRSNTTRSNATRSQQEQAMNNAVAIGAQRTAAVEDNDLDSVNQSPNFDSSPTVEAEVESETVNNPGRTPGQRMAARFEPSALAGYMGLDDADRAANFDAPIGAEGSDDAPDGPQIDPQEKEDEEETVTDDSPQIETEPEMGGGSGYSGSSSGSSGSSGSSEAMAYDPVFGDSTETSVASLLDAITERIDSMDDPASSSEDSYGLEDTILSKRPLSDDALSQTFLTNLGARNLGTANSVVDPATGTVYRNPAQARSAGVTNWVYKYVFDAKRAGSSLYSAVIG